MTSTIELNKLKISISGASHSPEISAECDGLPKGETFDRDKIQAFLSRRAPGKAKYATARKEPDIAEYLSGVDGNTLDGNHFKAIIRNTNTRSGDYENVRDVPRPAHADFPAQIKYGASREVAGGGHFSGRMTAPLCIIGGICKQLLEKEGVKIAAHIYRIKDVCDTPYNPINPCLDNLSDFSTLSEEASKKMQEVIEEARKNADSVGGIIECAATGLKVGIGEHMFYGLEADISRIVFAVPAVKGIEFGAGFSVADMYGSENNDAFYYDGDKIKTKTNNHGGILGGMASGMPLIFRAAIKPTPSIGKEQDSISFSKKENTKLIISGRHDPCILPRAVPVIEAACAIALYDAYLSEKDR